MKLRKKGYLPPPVSPINSEPGTSTSSIATVDLCLDVSAITLLPHKTLLNCDNMILTIITGHTRRERAKNSKIGIFSEKVLFSIEASLAAARAQQTKKRYTQENRKNFSHHSFWFQKQKFRFLQKLSNTGRTLYRSSNFIIN